MATNIAIINGVQNAGTTADNLYTSPANGNGTRITAFTASIGTGTETYRVFIGTTAVAANEIIQATAVRGAGQDSPLELVNHLIPANHSVFVQISTGATITVRASGIEF